ncbi:MAG: nuclear transport factor 2 family protein [Bacteroidota bacterium]
MPSSASSPDAVADHIRALRAESNAAIHRHDVGGVVSMYDAEYQITTGDGSFGDRTTITDAWAAEFARAPDLLYIRMPQEIEVSTTGSRAAETGAWSGSWTTAGGKHSTRGRYAAHWVRTRGVWKLRAELFVTLR